MSIRVKLLAIFGLLALVGVTSFVGLWLYGLPALGVEGLYAHEYRRAILTVEALADKERDALERWFDDHRRELRLLSTNETVSRAVEVLARQGGSSSTVRAQLARQLNMVAESSPGTYRFLYVVDRASGKMLASGQGSLEPVPESLLPVLDQAYAPGMTELISVRRDGAPEVLVTQQIVSLDAHGNPDGPVLGLLVASVTLEVPLNSNENSMRQMLGISGQVMLVDRDAEVLYRAASASDDGSARFVARQVVSGTEGAKLLKTDSGEELIAVFRYIHLGASDDLSLVVTRGTYEALALIRSSFWRILGLMGTFVLLAMALVLFAAKRIAEAEDQVHALNVNLEHRIAERTAELERSNTDLHDSIHRLAVTRDELVRSEKLAALGAMVAGVAHELNTPIGNSLTVASTLVEQTEEFSLRMSQGLTRSGLDTFVQSTRQGADILMHSLQRAAELVSSFKQVAVDQTSLNRRTFYLRDAINDILVSLGPTLRKSTHTVHCDIPPGIYMDSYPGQLAQIVTNLVNNAVIHGLDGCEQGEIHISARMHGADGVEFVVQDNGVGIPADHIAKVFDPFFTTRLGKGGSGLGLNIVYNLVKQSLGGSISVDSQPSAGARFTLLLPLAAPHSSSQS